jgi:hypothetical protein
MSFSDAERSLFMYSWKTMPWSGVFTDMTSSMLHDALFEICTVNVR